MKYMPSTVFVFSCLFLGWLVESKTAAQESPAAVPNETQVAEAVGERAANEISDGAVSRQKTVAESSGYLATADEVQVASFLRELSIKWDATELTTIGNTVEGRPLWALVVEPQEKLLDRPLTVLMLGGIHSGECDGKEALLALAADMAAGEVSGREGRWWESMRLIFIPNFNADGNERRGAGHRPGQAGPEAGMGIRENAQSLDLNRDFMKLESPEVRSLVQAIDRYEVDVLIDTHTTNGSLHRYELTYDIPHNPATPAAIDGYLRQELIPAVTEQVADTDGFSMFYYGNFDLAHRRWDTFGHEARYSTEYMGLRGRIGILAESYSYAPYQTRIEATYAFVREVLSKLAKDGEHVRRIIDESTSLSGPGQLLALQGTLAKTSDDVIVKGYQTADGKPPTGPFNETSAATCEPKDYAVQLWNRFEGAHFVQLPFAYAVDAQYAWAVERLRRHGIRVHRLTEPMDAATEQLTITQLERSSSFQQHEMLTLKAEARPAPATLVVGTYIIETSQSLGILAAHLLEPEADDSLARWNFFDPDVAKGSVYPVLRVLEPIPAELLVEQTSTPRSEQVRLENLYKPDQQISYGGRLGRGPTWLKTSSEYVQMQGNTAFAVDAVTGSMRRLTELHGLKSKLAALDAFTDAEATREAQVNAFSDDWSHALVSHSKDLYFFDAASQVARQLTHSPDEEERLSSTSPTGQHVAFVRDNNLWVVNCVTTELKQLTFDGSPELLNGILDWVYQEELYGRGNFTSFWWSPDGQRIAFLQLDQTPVPSYQVSDSISFGQSLEATRYPKAGEPLPTVRAWVADIGSGKLTEMDLSEFAADDRLVGRVSWSPAGELWLQVLNRVQNKQDLVRVDPSSGVSETLMTEVSSGWIELRDTPKFLPNGDFLWLSDLPTGRTHLYRVSSDSGQKTVLTSGDWEVDSFVGLSADHARAFVTGNKSNPIESHLIAIDLESATVTQITAAPGTHRVSVDHSGSFYLDTFSNVDAPPFAALYRMDGSLMRVVETTISDRHECLNLRSPQLFTIAARDGLPLQAMLLLPSNLDISKPDKQVPVVVHVYGGPQSPTVRNSWQGGSYWWHQMLCQQGFAVLLCDNRASRGRGVQDTWSIRGDLGRVELQDLEDAVAWLKQQAWADGERVGLWGWSYGGYFTSYALTHSQLFRAGIAGAPVTDWRNYDAIYTERYMDLPQDNAEGYESSSSVTAAANLHGELLLIHGERDDNVHISNSLQLAYALQQAGKQFQFMVYPKNRHGIVNPDQQYHMYRMMTDFLKQKLAP